MLKLYGFKKVNPIARGFTRDLRILWALEEIKLPYQLMGMDHPARDLNSESFRQLNPFEQLPVIDDDGIVLSESGAILIYLAKKAKKLIPDDVGGESQVIRWCFAATNSIEIPLMNILIMDWMDPSKAQPYRQFLVNWAQRHLKNLNRWLADKEFVATHEFTVADLLMAHVLSGVKDLSLLDQHENVLKYKERCLSRTAWKMTLENYFKNVEPG